MSYIGNLFIISAPSGAGKTSLVQALLKKLPNITCSISHTTRPKRPDEKPNVNYYFIDDNQFNTMVANNQFLEHANVFGHQYGTAWTPVHEKRKQGIDVILEIDYQGAMLVRDTISDATSIFIFPPAKETLKNRLHSRAQDTKEVIEKRLNKATQEMSHYKNFDFLVVNDDFTTALNELCAIITSTRLKRRNHAKITKQFLTSLLP